MGEISIRKASPADEPHSSSADALTAILGGFPPSWADGRERTEAWVERINGMPRINWHHCGRKRQRQPNRWQVLCEDIGLKRAFGNLWGVYVNLDWRGRRRSNHQWLCWLGNLERSGCGQPGGNTHNTSAIIVIPGVDFPLMVLSRNRFSTMEFTTTSIWWWTAPTTQ
jgi:hypothetical protein